MSGHNFPVLIGLQELRSLKINFYFCLLGFLSRAATR